MSTDLSKENREYIASRVRSGVYDDEATALDEAVLLLRKRDKLRLDVCAGIDQADRGELLPASEVFNRLEKRAAEIEATASTK